MKTTKQTKAKAANGQNTKLMLLGVLSLVLVGVLWAQFGGSDDSDAGQIVLDDSALGDKVAAAASAPPTDAIADAKAAVAEVNERLSEAPTKEGLESNPFTNFWSKPKAAPVQTTEELKPPTVTLNGTLTGEGDIPVALIDGRMHFVGDTIEGWRLTEVASRSIKLQAPTEESIEVLMPVIAGKIRIPDQSADS